jgi:hypothetical protein
MTPIRTKFGVFAAMLLVFAAALSACSNQMEPAKKAIADIEAAVAAAGPDAQRYIPDQLKGVTDQLADLKSKFDRKDYAAVVAAAPQLLVTARGLAGAKEAAMKEEAAKEADAKAAAEQALKTEWDTLSTAVPAAISAIDSRIGALAKARKLPANVTKAALASAKSDLADAKAGWEQATGSQTAGNMQAAVDAARQAKTKTDAAMASLAMSG